MNPHDHNDIKAALAAHHEWLRTQGHEGTRFALPVLPTPATNLPRLRDADLREADLSGAKGMLGRQLGGSDLCGATLSADLGAFHEQRLKLVEELSKNAGKLFVSLLLLCLFALLTVAQTRDADLFTNQGTTKLPVVDAEVSVVLFYLLTPAVLLSVYVYFHVYLQRLWEALAQLPAVFPDGETLDRKSHPWLVNDLIRDYFPRLHDECPPLSGIQRRLCVFLVWWLIPVSLLPFWAKYLVRRDWSVTLLHIAALVLAVWIAALFYRLARATLKGNVWNFSLWRPPQQDRRLWARTNAALVLGTMFFAGVSYAAFHGMPGPAQGERRYGANIPLYGGFREAPGPVRSPLWKEWGPAFLGWFHCAPFAQITQADLSDRPSGWKGAAPEDVFPIKGAELQGVDLRYANATGTFLVNAAVHEAELRGVNLVGADLRRAYMVHSNFMGADLQGAILVGANLFQAHLCGANFERAIFSREYLKKPYPKAAYVGEAKMIGVNLQHADLRNTNLRGADLRGADLRWADLRGADLRSPAPREANPPPSDPRTGKPRPTDLRGADLRGANLHGAYISNAYLDGAYYGKGSINNEDDTRWPRGFAPEKHHLRLLSSSANVPKAEKQPIERLLTAPTECVWCATVANGVISTERAQRANAASPPRQRVRR